VPPVPVQDLDLRRLEVVEAVEVDRDIVAPELLEVPASEAVDPAPLAEEAPGDLGEATWGR
jgi:hypothetical protein